MDWVTFCSHSNIKKRVSLAIQSFNRFFIKGTKFYFFPIKNGGRYPLFMGFSYIRSSGNISIPNLMKLSRKSRLLYLLSQKPLSLSQHPAQPGSRNESASAREIIHPIIHLRARNTAFVERPETQTFLFPHAWHIIIGLWADFSEAPGDAIRQNGC